MQAALTQGWMQLEVWYVIASVDYSNAHHICVHVQVDVEADRIIFCRLAECSSVQAASSEEQPEIVALPGTGYTVGFCTMLGDFGVRL